MNDVATSTDRSLAIDRDWIASRIPHQGSMCLLDGVEQWDEQSIRCIASSHRRIDNPLRADNSSHADNSHVNNTLGIANAIEYAAQAMAVHCALLMDAASAPSSGYLTSVRQVNWHRTRFDDVTSDLSIRVHRISGSDVTVLYGFEIHADETLLIDGRASVVLNAANLSLNENNLR